MITAKEIKAKVIPCFRAQIENLQKRRIILEQMEAQIHIDIDRLDNEINDIQGDLKHVEAWSDDDAWEPRV